MANNSPKAINIHENFALNLAYEDKILWDFYTCKQFPLFKEKLNELFREPEKGSSKAMKKIRQAVYDSTIAQSKYTNRNLLATFILVTVAKGTEYLQARDATKLSIHLIIRTRKCIDNDNSSNCCMVFIDDNGRVYKNWKHFVETNTLPEGVALAPSNGVYKYENGKLVLESWPTPASRLSSKILAKSDVAAGVGGISAAAVTLSALTLPISAPILAGAGAVCVGTGVYSTLRSVCSLRSRVNHEQSISLTDASARGDWLGVASGTLAVTSTVANRSLAQLALAGREVSLVREIVVNGMNISTMLLSGSGVANGIIDLILKYNDGKDVNGLDILQVAASLAIFTHSAFNFRLASRIITQYSTGKSSRTELSNTLRKLFGKMVKGSVGKMDVIRLINEVPDKLFLIYDMNSLVQNQVRLSNGQNLQITSNNGQRENSLIFLETINSLTQIAFFENSSSFANYVQIALRIASHFILNYETFQDCVKNLIVNVGENVSQYLIEKSKRFLETYKRRIENFIRTTLYLETVLWNLYLKCEQNLTTFTIETLEESMTSIFQMLLLEYEQMSCNNTLIKNIQCDVCKGSYQICSI